MLIPGLDSSHPDICEKALNQKIKTHFNWRPKYNLSEGLSHIFEKIDKVGLIIH